MNTTLTAAPVTSAFEVTFRGPQSEISDTEFFVGKTVFREQEKTRSGLLMRGKLNGPMYEKALDENACRELRKSSSACESLVMNNEPCHEQCPIAAIRDRRKNFDRELLRMGDGFVVDWQMYA